MNPAITNQQSTALVAIRRASRQDAEAIRQLHRKVAWISQGIARTEPELTEQYVDGLFETVNQRGLMLVAVDPENTLIAEIHASKYGIHVFDHVLTSLTVVVDPDYQGQGIGKRIFRAFLDEVQQTFPEVKRIELESRAFNQQSIRLYQSLGFVHEGRMVNKTKNADGSFEDSLLMAWYKPESS